MARRAAAALLLFAAAASSSGTASVADTAQRTATNNVKRQSKVYHLSDRLRVEAFAPALVTASEHLHEFVWYAKTLEYLGPGRLLLSHSTQADASTTGGGPIGVVGELFTSADHGQTWQRIARHPVDGRLYPGLTHCQSAGTVPGSPGEARCMADETSLWQPAGVAHLPRQAVVVAQRFSGATGAYLGSMNTSWKFTNDLAAAASGDKSDLTHFEMDMDGSVLQLPDGGLLASSYGPFRDGHFANCSRLNLTGQGAHSGLGIICTSVVISRSTDGGASWRQIGVASDTPNKTAVGYPCFSGSENSLIMLSNGTLVAVWRAGGPAHQPPTGEPICGAVSTDGSGAHWSVPVPLGWSTAAANGARLNASRAPPFNATQPHPYGVDPKLVQLHSGTLALSAGRVGLHVWLAPRINRHSQNGGNILEQLAAEDGGGWTGLNLAQAHNDLAMLAHMPADVRFTQAMIENGGGAPCDGLYTGMVNIPGTDRVLISYDKTTGTYNNGTVPSRVGNRSYIFVMELRVMPT